jgi:hypothetical protein
MKSNNIKPFLIKLLLLYLRISRVNYILFAKSLQKELKLFFILDGK